jgi:hypothetical protein
MVTAAKADDTDFDLGLLGLKMQVQSFLLIFFVCGGSYFFILFWTRLYLRLCYVLGSYFLTLPL